MICLRTTRPPKGQRDPGETKPRDPSQRPATDGGRTNGGGGEGTKNHPPPKQPGCKPLMAATGRRNKAEMRGRRRQLRRQREPAEQGTCPNTLTAQLALRLKTENISAVSTTRWRRRRHREANPVRGLRPERMATGPRPTERAEHRAMGGDEKPRRASAAQEETDGRETEESPPPERSPAPNKSGCPGGKGEGGPPPRSALPRSAAKEWGGTPQHSSTGLPRARGTRNQRGPPSELSERWSPTEDGPQQSPPPEQSPAPNASGRRRGEGGGGPPTQQRSPTACSGGKGGRP